MGKFVRVTDVDGEDVLININYITHLYPIKDELVVVFLNRGQDIDEDIVEITYNSGIKLINYLDVVDLSDEDYEGDDSIF